MAHPLVQHLQVFFPQFPAPAQGFAFDCDPDGIVDVQDLSPEGLAAYHACLLGEAVGLPVTDGGIEALPVRRDARATALADDAPVVPTDLTDSLAAAESRALVLV